MASLRTGLLGAALFGPAGAAWLPGPAHADLLQAVSEGDPAPDFELTDIRTGRPFRLSDFAGKVVCINWWAYW